MRVFALIGTFIAALVNGITITNPSLLPGLVYDYIIVGGLWNIFLWEPF